MKVFSIFCFIMFSAIYMQGQQTVGLFNNTSNSFDGYTLFAPIKSDTTYLIDNCGERIHEWISNYNPGLSVYLMDDGSILRTGKIGGMGGGSGIVEIIDWNSNVTWSYSAQATHGKQHHDIELLPNGNILLIVWDERSQGDVVQAGSSTSNTYINSEQIIEVQPDFVNGGGTVVWEWKAWDHLIQDADAGKDNYGTVSQTPERIDVNYLAHNSTDWLHFNGVAYNAALDQIIISVRSFNEFWIIDHSTTTAESASSSGGNSGKGGNLLYRWGNPESYQQGTVGDRTLFFQHHAQWIADTLSEAGKIILFNNQAGSVVGQNYSQVNTINLPLDSVGNYTYLGGAYGPTTYDWTYQAPNPTDFYSNIISGVQRLPNGNTLICEGVGGRFFEVDDIGTKVWEYVNPVNDVGIIAQNVTPTVNNVFRCTRYPVTHSAFVGKILTPQGYLESGSTFSCNLYTSTETIEDYYTSDFLQLYPNPVSSSFTLEFQNADEKALTLDIIDINGRLVVQKKLPPQTQRCDVGVDFLPSGLYLVKVIGANQIWTKKLIVNQE
ncbi:MAG: aryl-sulfate sulfotransferase [Aureispira sp.]|nr:aryl-sulfate sulfotransferase [Aureispira sp.]